MIKIIRDSNAVERIVDRRGFQFGVFMPKPKQWVIRPRRLARRINGSYLHHAHDILEQGAFMGLGARHCIQLPRFPAPTSHRGNGVLQ